MKKWKKRIRIVLGLILLLVFCYVGVYAYARFTPKLPIDSANSYYLYDIENNLVSNGNSKEWIGLDEISPYLINATISIEDKNFYKHQGFDFLRIMKAMYINIKNGKTLQGASTISQQYAKNLFLDFGKTWDRKIEEAWLTIRLEAHYSKEQILEGYLNTINYGGIFGIENASQYYFNKSAKDLNLAEATILAGIPKWPSVYSPLVNEEASKKRQKLILESMIKNKYITESEKEEALKTKLTYNGTKSQHNLSTLTYYQDAVIEELKRLDAIPPSFLETGGLRIYTNLDLSAQTAMENNIKKYMSDNDEIQIASVIVDPSNGAVLALAGGTDYSKSQYNRAISSKRQVGSTMKPFLYYSALENGFTPSTTFTSEKTTFTFAENKTYSPKNYGENYPNKPISMAAALSYSDNIYAVKTHLFLGENTLVETAKRVGINSSLDAIPSLALGSEEIGILEMMEGYTAFANEGYKIEPYFIRKVEDANGNVLYEKKEKKEQVLNKSIVYVLNEMLTNSYAREFVDYNYPTCISIAPRISKKYAIKTGTTETDHWIFGYNKKLLMGVWNGYDDNRTTGVDDGAISKNIWVDTMEELLENEEDYWYDIPKNVVGAFIDPISGNLANEQTTKKKMLYYIKGTEPSYEDGTLDAAIPTIKTTE